MPDPLSYSYNVVKPFAYETTTQPVHQKGYTNSTRNFGSGTLSGASAGSAFGPYGAALGGAVGLGTDIWQAIFAKRRAAEANEESRKAAAEASARLSAEARAAREYNSEQSQIRRMRMAGLSPGLAYGQMSPSTAVAASQEKADVHKSDTPKFDNESILRALELLVKQQQADTAFAAQQSTSALQGSQIDLNQIDKLYRGAEYQANILATLADAGKSDAEKLEIIKLLSSRQNNLDANTRNLNAAANVVEKTGVDLANSQIASYTASAELAKQQKDTLKLEYDINEMQWNQVKSFMKEYQMGDLLTPVVMRALSSFANNTGQTISSVISSLGSVGSSIIDIINRFIPEAEFEDYIETEKSGSKSKSVYDEQTTIRKGRRRK